MATQNGWNFDNSYARLHAALWESAEAAFFPRPAVAVVNHALARELGLDFAGVADEELASIFTGQRLPAGATPIAQAYAGHQYGHFTMLGDGRAILMGEQIAPGGKRFDIQFKGSGETPFSRRGDGRAALGPMLREHIVGEALHGLGIPTTRSLAVTTTGEMIARDGAKRGAVLTRVAASHIRVGTFQYAAATGDLRALRALADHAIVRHDPDLGDRPDRYARFLDRVIARQAELIALWQSVGFVHGVMNTDNMAVSGETIDLGPCAFLDAYDPDAVFSSIDRHGRYRYGQQPAVAQWNLARFAEALVPILAEDETVAVALANEALAGFAPAYRAAWLRRMRAKIGLAAEHDGDDRLVHDLLDTMHRARADFTIAFRTLSESDAPQAAPFDGEAGRAWIERWQARLAAEARGAEAVRAAMRAVNPAVHARNHRVEEALAAAGERDDLRPAQELVEALARPFDPPARLAHLCDPPPAEWCGYRTFCGT
ncbi:MAG: protein adenylyltransferase SelO [Planctomycetota bacterium]